jgi:MraZ protein
VQEFSQKLMASTSLFQARSRLVQRRILPRPRKSRSIAWQNFGSPEPERGAGLSRECVILGISKYIEIWNAEEYKKYLDENQGEFMNSAEELGGLTSRRREAYGRAEARF